MPVHRNEVRTVAELVTPFAVGWTIELDRHPLVDSFSLIFRRRGTRISVIAFGDGHAPRLKVRTGQGAYWSTRVPALSAALFIRRVMLGHLNPGRKP
jgi:hypothetical protein